MAVELNPEQREAVRHGEGPLLVLAGAGSGKTRVLTARAARLIREEGVPPDRILAVTFTNKAADEMKDRIRVLLGRAPAGMWAGTFHSIAARLLRREADLLDRGRNFTIYDQDDSRRVVKRAMEEVGIDPERWSPRAIQGRISDAKNAVVGPEEYEKNAFDLVSRRTAEAYPVYERLLRRANAYDFDDLLLYAVRVLEEHGEVAERYGGRFLHILVDEYQDTNHAQYRIVRRLARAHGNLCVVGDDDQSIYGWRGADLRNILDFERDFSGAKVVRLERNYRSTSSILEAANAVIARNEERKPKTLRTTREPGAPVVVVKAADEKDEARWTVREIEGLVAGDDEGAYRPSDCAVLYRTNAQSRAYEDALREADLPYRIVGGVRFYERREIRDVLAYLGLAVNPVDEEAFRRAVSWPRRGVGSVTLERLTEAAREAGEPLTEAAARATEVDAIPTAGARSLEAFAEGVRELHELQVGQPVERVIRACVRSFGILTALEEEEDGEDRIANVTELVAAATGFDRADVEGAPEDATDLALWMQQVALLTDRDRMDEDPEGVTLMTLHNAKGLEFPVVFVGGLEEGLFPLSRAVDAPGGLEEERRLFYVGVTRAEDRLYLSHAERRWRAGRESRSSPSSFLEELPEAPVERRLAPDAARRTDERGRAGDGSAARAGRWPFSGGGSAKSSGWKRGSGAGRGRGSTSWSGEVGGGDFSWRRGFGDGADDGADDGGSPSAPGGDGPAGDLPGERGDAGGAGTGPTYDFADTQEPLVLEPGARVVHPRFGEGTVRSVSGSGRRLKAEIDFASVGRKKVRVAHADLRPA